MRSRVPSVCILITGLFAVAAPVAVGLLDGVTVRAQTVSPDLRFEVASVRAGALEGRGPRTSGIPGPNNTDPGRFTTRNRLLGLVAMAYDVPLSWLVDPDDRLFLQVEIEAKMPATTTREQFSVMLQNLLADRLGIKVHWATRDMDTYTLVVAKGGPKFKPASPDSLQPDSTQGSGDGSRSGSPIKVEADGFPLPPPGNDAWLGQSPDLKVTMRGHNETVAEIARAISQLSLGGALTDATGLTGKYDYTIFWSMQATMDVVSGRPPVEPDGLNVFDAIQEQLGLKIEKKKGPVQVLVVDHVEKKPTEN